MKKKFISKFSKNYAALQTGGRKKDSAYFRIRIAHKKIAYVNFLIKNIDQLVIVASLVYPKFKSGLIDRFLTLAHWSQKQAVIILTKRDLAEAAWVEEVQAIYKNLPYKLYILGNRPDAEEEEAPNLNISKKHVSEKPASQRPGSKKSALSEDKKIVAQPYSPRGKKIFFTLRDEVFKGKRSAIVGHSGVGKTAMLTRIDSDYRGRVNTVSSFTRRGRHTTTRITRHDFKFGGEFFDMPGLKELDFTDVTQSDLRMCYPEFRMFEDACAFKNCLHHHEPNCAVQIPCEEGKIHPIRYRNYLQILSTLEKY